VTALPQDVKTLLQKPVFVHFATEMKDGSPQVSPVWVDVEDDTILVNTAEGRLKDKNVRRDPRVALSFLDPDNPYHSVTIRGRVTEVTNEGADAHIDKLAKKYLGQDKYPWRSPDEERVLYKIEAEHVAVMG
jgi:PPOX class probable F420-dependent enzyme